MLTAKEAKEALSFVETVENITKTYQEIANLRMKQIKDYVLKNRRMFEEILETYKKVKASYFFALENQLVPKIEFKRKSKRLVFVFLSANEFFYGGLISEIWKKIKEELKFQRNADLAIIGKIGKMLAERDGVINFFYFDLDDVRPEKEKLETILKFLQNYRKIVVFFAKYKGGFSQKIEKTEIVGEFLRERGEMKGEYYIFEPSPKEVLEFFEHEMIGILFHQTILEHQLARYSARVLAMFQATEKAKKMKEEIKIAVAKFERFLKNKKQIELFGGMPTWKISEK